MTWAKRCKGCDVVNPFIMAAPAVTLSEPCHREMRPESSSGERKRQTRSASCASNSKQLIRG